MKTACGIIQDLLPLYVDEVCSAESGALVEAHLLECAACGEKYAAMHAQASKVKETNDMKLADGLKKLKIRVGKRTRYAILASVAIVLALFIGGEALFNLPLKELKMEDVHVSAEVYAVDDLPTMEDVQKDDSSVTITKYADDIGDLLRVQLPEGPNVEIVMSENAAKDTGYITIVHWNSEYQLNTVKMETPDEDSETLYIKEYKTTFLGNKAGEATREQIYVATRKFSRIVYVNDDGSETLLWQAPVQIQAADAIEP